MKLYKIKALMYRDFNLLLNSKFRIVETFYFPITSIIIWGFFALYAKTFSFGTGIAVLIVNIFWNFSFLTQSVANMMINEDVWSGSLKQDLLSGITEFEYIFARIISSSIISIFVLVLMLGIGLFFGIAPFLSNTIIIGFIIMMSMFTAIALLIMIAGIFIYLGREYSFLAWTFLQIFVVFSAPFFPISVYPDFLQPIVRVMPFTYIFDGIRELVATGVMSITNIILSVTVASVYFLISLPIYYYSFRHGKKTGSLVRND